MQHTHSSRRQFLGLLGAGLAGSALVLPGAASAADTLGSRPVRIIVPFPAGGGGDTLTRMVGDALSQQLKLPVVVENKPGGDGVIAVQELLRAAPDGHTIMFGTPSALLYTPQLTPKRPPYDPLKDLAPITHFSSFTYYVYVSDALPVKTMGELVDYVRKHPGKVAYGTGDSTQLVAMAQLCDQAKLDMIHVHYKGAYRRSPTSWAGASGDGRRLIWKEQFKGKALPLATLLPERSPLKLNVPALSEAGLAVTTGLDGVLCRKHPPIIDQLNKAFAATFRTPSCGTSSSHGSVQASTPGIHELLVEQLPCSPSHQDPEPVSRLILRRTTAPRTHSACTNPRPYTTLRRPRAAGPTSWR